MSLRNEIYNFILNIKKPVSFIEIQNAIHQKFPNENIKNLGIQIQTLLKILISDELIIGDKYDSCRNEILYIIHADKSIKYYNNQIEKNVIAIQRLQEEIENMKDTKQQIQIYNDYVNEKDLLNQMNDMFLKYDSTNTMTNINGLFTIEEDEQENEIESMFGIESIENMKNKKQSNFNKLDEKLQTLLYKTVQKSKEKNINFFKISMKDYIKNDKLQKACMAFCIDFKSNLQFFKEHIQVDFPSDIQIDISHLEIYEEIQKQNEKQVSITSNNVLGSNNELPKLKMPEPPKFKSFLKVFLKN